MKKLFLIMFIALIGMSVFAEKNLNELHKKYGSMTIEDFKKMDMNELNDAIDSMQDLADAFWNKSMELYRLKKYSESDKYDKTSKAYMEKSMEAVKIWDERKSKELEAKNKDLVSTGLDASKSIEYYEKQILKNQLKYEEEKRKKEMENWPSWMKESYEKSLKKKKIFD